MNRVNIEVKKATLNLSLLLARVRKLPELGAVVTVLTLIVVFSLFEPGFFTLRNFTGIFTLVSELGIMAIGIAFLMIAGEFDLSVSSVYALSGFIFVVLANSMNSVIALIITLIATAIIGLLNGMLTLRARIPSFITTLGMMMFLRGIMLGITGGGDRHLSR